MIPAFHEAIVSYLFSALVFITSIVGFFHRSFYYSNVFQPSQVFSGKRPWTLFSSALVHSSWLHLLFNLIMCVFFMTEVEYMLVDDFGYPAAGGGMLLLLVGIVSSCNLIAGYRLRKQPTASAVGLSGFVFAMAVFFYMYFPLDTAPGLPGLRAYHFALVIPIACMVAWMIKLPGNHGVHQLGCVTGAIAAVFIRPEIVSELCNQFNG